ncbi:MAG: 2-dehydropantoate 2-reductase [Chloroflexi bacterium]|nr:2-dehydropantoate 2-reductase [Chloroflexota bacterium]
MSQPFAIVGAGALGQSFAALLARAGCEVTLLSTERTAERLRAFGEIRLVGAVEARVPLDSLRLTADPEQLPRGAGVIFTTKGQDLPRAVEHVRDGSQVGWVAGVQNGVQKDDLLSDAFGAERTLGAATIFGARRTETGEVHVGSSGMTYLGEFGGRLSDRAVDAATALQNAGIPTEARSDIESVLWSKACNATGVFGVTVLARASNQRLFSDRHLMSAYLALVRETAAVARAGGVQVGNFKGFPPIQSYVERSEADILAEVPEQPFDGDPPAYASMTNDLLAGFPLEVEGVFGDVVERGTRQYISVPCLRFVRDMIRGLNRGSI